MLSKQQKEFRDNFLSPIKQRFFYFKSLPMALISGIKLIHLDENKSIAKVPFRWCNKNPFQSMYFAVQSMAAELSTAAPALMALKASDRNIAFIIVEVKAEFIKKAQSTISFCCLDYDKFHNAISSLDKANDAVTVTAKTVGKDTDDDDVAIFYFTWSFKVRS